MQVCLSLCLQTIAPNITIESDFNKPMFCYFVCNNSLLIIEKGLVITFSTFQMFQKAVVTILKVVVLTKRRAILQLVLTTDLLMYIKISNDPTTFLYYRSSRFRMAGSGLGRSLSLHDVA